MVSKKAWAVRIASDDLRADIRRAAKNLQGSSQRLTVRRVAERVKMYSPDVGLGSIMALIEEMQPDELAELGITKGSRRHEQRVMPLSRKSSITWKPPLYKR